MTDGPSITNLGPAMSDFRKKLLDLDSTAEANEVANPTMPRMARGTVELPFRCIVNAREDVNLVRLVLRRHCEGEPFQQNYAVSGIVKDTILGEFPGRCYGTVRVCFACFCVYDLLERARKLAFISDGLTSKKILSETRLQREPKTHKQDVKNATDTRISGNVLTPEVRAVIRAQEAISRLTTLDVAELRSYASPPPGVSLVTTAMFVLLSGGKILNWLESRHAMANGETFLSICSVHNPITAIQIFTNLQRVNRIIY